jgi:deoxyribonuclease-4
MPIRHGMIQKELVFRSRFREVSMPILGAHMSIAGGYYKAVEAAAAAGCECVQIFTKNNSQWKAKPITDQQVSRFRLALREHGIAHAVSHASYLINLASPQADLLHKSRRAMVVEVQRAQQLGIPYVIVHPGSYTTSDEATGIETICRSLDYIHAQLPDTGTRILLENTAGQGTNLGWRFQQLGRMIRGAADPVRIGVCIDTCHACAAGYELADPEGYENTVKQLQRHVGLRRIKAFHLNDSKHPCGSRKDRHEHIGRGHVGPEAFRHLLNDRRFRNVPMYLETAKGREDGEDLDVINLQTLRDLVADRTTER